MSLAATSSSFEAGGVSRLWNRQLDSYPETARRFLFLGITVLCTVTLYYELYVTASVSTLLLVKLHMSFTFFVYSRAGLPGWWSSCRTSCSQSSCTLSLRWWYTGPR
jgi:hypothetical protein